MDNFEKLKQTVIARGYAETENMMMVIMNHLFIITS